jgi:hypothetical protein
VKDFFLIENMGIPSVIICSTAFHPFSVAIAKTKGAPEMPIIDIKHPMHTATNEEVSVQAAASLEMIIKALTEMPLTPILNAYKEDTEKTITVPGDYLAVNEYFQDRGWTDGLPIIPPTIQLIEMMLSYSNNDPEKEISLFPPLMRPGNLKQIAINAVMAGCKPEYFPAIISCLEAVIDDACQLFGIQSGTNAATPLFFFNGPIVKALKINSGRNLFGTGCRANSTIGRAVHLVLQNIGGEIPGETDLSTHGQPGKYTFCIAEAEDTSPWEPFHIERGFHRHDSIVSVVGSNGPQNIFAYGCETGEEILDTIVGAITALGNNNIIFSTGPERGERISFRKS